MNKPFWPVIKSFRYRGKKEGWNDAFKIWKAGRKPREAK